MKLQMRMCMLAEPMSHGTQPQQAPPILSLQRLPEKRQQPAHTRFRQNTLSTHHRWHSGLSLRLAEARIMQTILLTTLSNLSRSGPTTMLRSNFAINAYAHVSQQEKRCSAACPV